MKEPAGTAVLAAIALGVVLGCGSGSGSAYEAKPIKKPPPAAVKPGEEASLFPLKVGNQWTYVAETQTTTSGVGSTVTDELTLRVAKVEPFGGGSQATIEVVSGKGRPTTYQIWRADKAGIYQVRSDSKSEPFVPPQPAIKFPATAGSKFEWTGTGPTATAEKLSTTVKSTILAPQEIDTMSERVSAIPVEMTSRYTGKNGETLIASVTYWVPNIGLARMRQEIRFGNTAVVQVLRLKANVVK